MGQLLAGETPMFATGLLFGAVLLCAGMSLGLLLGRRPSLPRESASLDTYHLLNLVRGLNKWTDGFASDVSHYRQIVDNACEQFSSVQEQNPDPDDKSVVGMLSQIVQANEDLQSRLNRAETALQDQKEEIAGYMSEARTDTLTGLPNRRVFDDELARRIAELRRSGAAISVMLTDIDHFKRFNDHYGHLAGDAVLEQVARVLRGTMRESDLVTRIGGEEFAVILPSGERPYACQAAERARKAIEQSMFRYEGKQLRVTISCGVAQAARDETVSSLVKRADEAMYASKAAGRNSAHWHDGETCFAITRGDASRTPATSAPPSGSTSEGGFRQVCNDLRNRLLTVAHEELGPSE